MIDDQVFRAIVQDVTASIHRRLEDQNRVADQRHSEILDRFEHVNGKVGRAHDRVSHVEGRIDGLERRRGNMTESAITLSDLRVWILFGIACIGGTLAFLRFIGKL